jgi:hypothetical protein
LTRLKSAIIRGGDGFDAVGSAGAFRELAAHCL